MSQPGPRPPAGDISRKLMAQIELDLGPERAGEIRFQADETAEWIAELMRFEFEIWADEPDIVSTGILPVEGR